MVSTDIWPYLSCCSYVNNNENSGTGIHVLTSSCLSSRSIVWIGEVLGIHEVLQAQQEACS